MSGGRGVDHARGGSAPEGAGRVAAAWRRRARAAPDARCAPAARGRGGAGAAHVDGHRRARPRARRWPRSWLARAARRLSGHRQVDAYEHGARQPAGGGSQDPLRQRRGVGRAGAPARRAPGLRFGQRGAEGSDPRRDRPRDGTRRDRCRRPGRVCDRLGADAQLGGAVGQVREVAGRIMELAKARGTAVILVGHVTKEGALAGPRVLEHLVDCVLQFEGERERTYRTVRAIKNRFGSTNEAGLFEMRSGGLVEVLDAPARFVAEATRAPGSVVLAAMEGSRPLLVEVQALVAPSELEQPRRVVSGLDRNRLALVLAILGRHGRIGTGGADVFVNVVGGVRVDEPGCDLAVALAVASASRGVPIAGTPRACFGEL